MKIGFFIGKGIAAPHIIKSSAKALQRLGNRVRMIYLESEKQSIEAFVRKFSPDIIVALDHKGIDDQELEKLKIPYISWFVDHPIYFISPENFNSYHKCAITDRSFSKMLKEMNCRKVIHLPLAGDPEIFNGDKTDNISAADICYVGSFPGVLEDLKKRRQEKFSKVFNDVINVAFETKLENSEMTLNEVFEAVEKKLETEFIKELGYAHFGSLCHMLDTEIDSLNKTNLIDALRPYNYEIYGSKTWNDIKNIGKNYRGEIAYGEELSKLYSQVKINIILTRPQIHSGVNQRVFDIPLSKGFFLCDYREDLKHIFPKVFEKITFKNMTELKQKIDYFLKNPGLRTEITEYCYSQVIEFHTYEKRMQELVKMI